MLLFAMERITFLSAIWIYLTSKSYFQAVPDELIIFLYLYIKCKLR